jgi:hypothetical protein
MDFTGSQLQAIELLASGGKTNAEIAEIVNVSETTIYNWKNNKDFCEAILVRSQELFRNTQPEVINALVKRAKSGDPAAMRIYFDHIELVDKLRANIADMNITFTWEIPPSGN